MSRCVLDASALLAFLHRERGSDRVALALEAASINAVNLAEVAAKLMDRGASNVEALIEDLAIAVVALDEILAYRVAALRPTTKALGLSLGDRACLATAQHFGIPAMTTDRSWLQLDLGIQIQVIR